MHRCKLAGPVQFVQMYRAVQFCCWLSMLIRKQLNTHTVTSSCFAGGHVQAFCAAVPCTCLGALHAAAFDIASNIWETALLLSTKYVPKVVSDPTRQLSLDGRKGLSIYTCLQRTCGHTI